MIELRMSILENIIKFDERYIQVLEITPKDLYKKITFIFNKYFNNIEDGNDLIILEDGKRLEVSKSIMVINDFFNLDINSNKIIKALYNDVELEYNVEYGEDDLRIKLEEILSNIKEILLEYDFELEFKQELKLSELLKTLGLKFNQYCYDEPFTNLLCIFDLISMFHICKVLVLINVKVHFNEEELMELYKSALQRNIKLLIIESSQKNNILEYENKLFIDEDYDEFILK